MSGNYRRLLLSVVAISTFDFSSNICHEMSPVVAISISQNSTDKSNIIKLNQEGAALFRSGKYQDAILKFEQVLIICRSIGDRKSESTTLNNIGLVYKSLGQYQKAIEYYQQSLVIKKEIGDRRNESTTLTNLGLVYDSLGQYQKAIGYYQQSLVIKKEIGDRAGEGVILNNLGLVYDHLGQYQKAIEYYQQSLVVLKEIGSRAEQATILNNLGSVYDKLGQYQKAIEYCQQSLSISKETGDRDGEGTSLNSLGLIHNNLGQYQKAIEYYQQSLVINKEIGNRSGEGTTLNNIGSVYNHLEQYQKASEYYQQSLIVSKEIGNRAGQGTSLNNLGSVYSSIGQYQKAIEYYQQSLVIKKEIGDRTGEGTTLGNLGETYHSLGQYQKAMEYYQQSLSISKQTGDRAGEGTTLNNLGVSLYQLKRLPAAELVLRQSIEIWESLRTKLSDTNKISFADKVAVTYKLLQKVLIEQNKIEAALAISERARARALVELLTSKVRTVSSQSAIDKIRIAPNLSKIKQIAKQKNATLVQYSIVDDTVYIWVIQPNGKVSFKPSKIPPQTKLEDLVVATRDSISANRGRRNKDDEKNPPQAKLQQLHQLLIAPIAAYLPAKATDSVIILPQQELFSVPFAALQNPQGKYLIESHTITIAPSIQVLGLTQSKPTSKGTPLIVGNPIMPIYKGEQLASLAGAEKEAQAIGEILRVQPLIGKAADKQEVIARMRQASLIHFATHGFFERVEGDLPGAIALTNGFLTSDEIFDLNLAADLVVLSACDTGRGKLTGDGVIGLSRSLVVAGVPSVVVSLWEVSDDATKVLMSEFYRQLSINKLSKAQALRQAMLKTKTQFADPNLWAAFMLVGEGI